MAYPINMLTTLDHIVLICPDLDKGIADYTALLWHGPVWQSEDGGVQSALFRVENTALELLAPVSGSEMETRFGEILAGRDGALTSLAFATEDINAAQHTLTRRGLAPSNISQKNSTDLSTETTRQWERFRCDDAVCAGIKTFVLERKGDDLPAGDTAPGAARSLDHIVINTPNPERAIAHYGARLGLRFALDRTIKAFKTRFLFFRIGGLTLELIQSLGQDTQPSDLDTFWGLTWKTDDLAAAHERLDKAGVIVSEIRTGRKPGTRVFTVKSGTLGIPTLFLEQAERQKD